MQLFVQTMALETVELEVSPAAAVEEVLARLPDEEGKPNMALRCLIFKHEEPCEGGETRTVLKLLLQGQSLADHDIPASSTLIEAVDKLHLESNRGGCQMFIRLPSGKTIAINVDEHTTIRDIKLQIQDREGISVEEQSLVSGGQKIRPDTSLVDDHPIMQMDYVQLVMKSNLDKLVEDDSVSVICKYLLWSCYGQ